MSITLQDIFPNVNTGLSQIGFFLGAGSSYAAGYPLTSKLTTEILKKLDPTEIILLDKIVTNAGKKLDITNGDPDIEILSDLLYSALNQRGFTGVDLLIDSIRFYLVEVIKAIASPDLQYHTSLFKSLKRFISNRNEVIWIFTTNYDLVLEYAASLAKIPVYNGFEGISQRYFDIERLNLTYGRINSNRRFETFNEPSIKLMKLHGSISWFKQSGDIFETFEHNVTAKRCMVLPRRTKVVETLDSPYDKLFRNAVSILGKQCKYLVSCGYSFRDEHINDIIFNPKLRNNSIRLFSLLKEENSQIQKLKTYPSFHFLVENKLYLNGKETLGAYDQWDFKKFIELFK